MRLRPGDPPDARRLAPPPEGDRPIEPLLLAHRALERWVAERFAATPETFSLAKYEVGLGVVLAALAAGVLLRRRGAPVFAAAFAAYAIALGHVARFPPTEHDESEYVLLAAALLRDGTTRIDDDLLDGTLVEAVGKVPANFEPIVAEYRAGRRSGPLWSFRAPALPILLAPGYGIGRALDLPRPGRWVLAYLPLAAVGAAAVAASARLGLSGLPLLALAASPPFVHFSTRPLAEIVGAALAAWVLVRATGPRGETPRPAADLLTGLLAGLMPLVHFRHAYVAAPLGLLALARARRRGATLAGLAVGALASAAAYSNAARSAAGGGIEFGAPIWLWDGYLDRLASLLVGPNTGLLVYAPVVLLALAASGAGLAAAAGGLLFGLYLLLIAGYRNAHESFPFARYLVVALPLLAPATAAGAARLGASRTGRAAVVALSLYTILRGVVAATVPYTWRMTTWFP